MSANKEIYDRIVKNEMDRAKAEQQYGSLERRQRILAQAGVDKKKIDAGVDKYKANQTRLGNMYDAYVDMQKAGMDRDADLLRESVNILRELNEFQKNNPIILPQYNSDGSAYRIAKDGTRIEMSEIEAMEYEARNEKINSLYDLILGGYTNIRGNKASDLSPNMSQAQIDALKRRTGNNSSFVMGRNGLQVKDDGRTISELSNDYLDKLGTPKDFNDMPSPVDADVEQKKGALKDLTAPKKGGIKAGANQGVNTGSGFRDSVKNRLPDYHPIIQNKPKP